MSQKIEQAWSLLNKGEIDKAFDVAKSQFYKDGSPEVRRLVGCCQKALEQYRYAAINIQKSLNIKACQQGPNVTLAECLSHVGHYSDAINHCIINQISNVEI